MGGQSIDDIKVGLKTRVTKTVSESDVYLFAGITGDFDPNHVDEEYTKKTSLGHRVAHGALIVGYTSAASTRILEDFERPMVSVGYDRIRFLKPVYFGDTLTIDQSTARLAIDWQSFNIGQEHRLAKRLGERLKCRQDFLLGQGFWCRGVVKQRLGTRNRGIEYDRVPIELSTLVGPDMMKNATEPRTTAERSVVPVKGAPRLEERLLSQIFGAVFEFQTPSKESEEVLAIARKKLVQRRARPPLELEHQRFVARYGASHGRPEFSRYESVSYTCNVANGGKVP